MPKKANVPKVLAAVMAALGIRRARAYQKAKELAARAQVDTETGLYLLAAQSQINLSKLIPQDRLERVRQLLPQVGVTAHDVGVRRLPQKAVKNITVTVGKAFTVKDPILPESVVVEAKTMAEEIYPILYVLENSVRQLILRTLSAKHGEHWWDNKVSKPIKEEVQRRMANEAQNPWHGKRGRHPIYYTDLIHLGRIVQNNWQDFETILPSAQWLSQHLEEISHSRNPAMHMNPLAPRDIGRVKIFFEDWESQISSKRNLISGGE